MGILSENSIVGASYKSPVHYDYKIDNSLKFNDDDSAYLSRTPTTAGNRKTWTWSGWVKRGNLSYQGIFEAKHTHDDQTALMFENSGTLLFTDRPSNVRNIDIRTTQLFRDVGAWYHIIVAVDTTQGISTNRVKIYVNGSQVTSFSSPSYPSQNYDTAYWNNTQSHRHGYTQGNSAAYLDGYLAEVNFIDGQALTPSDFGSVDALYGDWKPKAYTGTHGTNGFYLPFKQDYTVEGFSAVTYTGDSTTSHLIQGVGYQPDVVWLKTRTNQADSHALFDAVRGGGYHLRTDSNLQHLAGSFSYDTNGFTLGNNDGQTNSSSNTYIAWTWDMGGTTVSNTNGSITSSVRANSAYGQSIVKYTGVGGSNPTSNTIGHGLAAAPEMIILKKYTQADDWQVYHKDLDTYTLSKLILNTTASTVNDGNGSSFGSPRNIGSSTFTIGYNGAVSATGADHIAYCFHSVAGYSKIGSYTGTAASGNSVTTGFRPAFVLVKNTSSVQNWYIFDSARYPNNTIGNPLPVNTTGTEDSSTGVIDFDANGFTLQHTDGAWNATGDTYIYMAFADTKEYSFFTDQSTNSNHWTPNNISSVADVMLDSPTNNFATMNPLADGSEHSNPASPTANTYSEGNLKTLVKNNNYAIPTIIPISGKWYMEHAITIETNETCWGLLDNTNYTGTYIHNTGQTNRWVATEKTNTLYLYDEGSTLASTALTLVAGDIIQLAYDIDNAKAWIGVNDTWYTSSAATSGNPSAGTGETFSFTATESLHLTPVLANGTGDQTFVSNFGQDSSFAGTKTAQGNQDSNSIGDFYYTPPTDFLALCSANLPDPTVKPSEHFNTVLYSGTGSSVAVTGVGFQPDLVWGKNRSSVQNNWLIDSVRGAGVWLASDGAGAEGAEPAGSSFTSDGFTTNNNSLFTYTNQSYALWNWKAGGAAVSNTSGSITSSVSANVDAGFSIVSYTGTGSLQTVGHGLSKAPEMILFKNRSLTGTAWNVFHEPLGVTNIIWLNLGQQSYSTSGNEWNATLPSNTVFTVKTAGDVNRSGDDHIAYAFHSVDGYSKVGSYTGNGSADGPFIYTGFKPAFLLVKQINAGNAWHIGDSVRDPYNLATRVLFPSNTNAEQNTTSNAAKDFLSNGFKWRMSDADSNGSGSTYLYLAFAEMPSKWARGR